MVLSAEDGRRRRPPAGPALRMQRNSSRAQWLLCWTKRNASIPADPLAGLEHARAPATVAGMSLAHLDRIAFVCDVIDAQGGDWDATGAVLRRSSTARTWTMRSPTPPGT
jgi:hypothetical protein